MTSNKILYIALLGGINVGGHHVKMDHLRMLFQELGYENVRSYIQTGNIFFETEEKQKEVLQLDIKTHLQDKLGYNVPVCLRTIDELEHIIGLDPFKSYILTPDTRFSVTFLSRPVDNLLPIPSITPDHGFELIAMTPTEMYIIWHLKQGRPTNSYGFGKSLEVESTTRFWHTTAKILVAAQAK